jgi:hypothetical protein
MTHQPLADPTSERLEQLACLSDLGMALAVALTAAALLALVRSARGPWILSRLHTLHANQRGLAALEFLLVFFPLLYIVLAVWQLAFMLNAQMHVGYAAYLAARSASTVVYMDLPDEEEGMLLNSGGNGKKWERINRAAIPATLPISPGNAAKAAEVAASSAIIVAIEDSALPDFDVPDIGAVPAQISLMTAHRGTAIAEGIRMQRAGVKALYAANATRVLINGRDADGNGAGGGQSNNPLNLSGADVLSVTVEYDFWLNVPYAGRMMHLAFGGNPLAGDFTEPTLTLRETVAINAWPKVAAY